MSDSQPIDLSELQSLQFGPSWAGGEGSAGAKGEVVWGRAEQGGRQDQGEGGFRRDRRDGPPRGRDNRGPRDDARGRGPGRDQRDNRGPARGPGGAPRQPGQENTNRPAGERPAGQRREGGGARLGGERRQDDRRHGGGNQRGGQGGGRWEDRGGQQATPRQDMRPLYGWQVKLEADPRALEGLTKQIKASGRAFAVFDVARLFLSARDRYLLKFFKQPPAPEKKPEQDSQENARPARPAPKVQEEIFLCKLDSTLWLTREDALRHARESSGMSQFYREETVDVEPPKGNFSSMAVCGFSGTILGPPNHHAFPVNVARLHREKFSNMALDHYKGKIRIEKDEATIQRWVEQQSKELRYVEINPPEGQEAQSFKTIQERDAHFLKTHGDKIVESYPEITVSGLLTQKRSALPLLTLARMEVDRQQRFPMSLVQDLCRELEGHGLKFFKRDRKTIYVSRSRPHYIEPELVLSDRVRSIVEMVKANPGIDFARVVSTLAKSPGAAEEGAPHELSTDELAIMQDLKWLVQEGYITEFSGGDLHVLGRDRPDKKPREGKPAPETATPAESNEMSASEVTGTLEAMAADAPASEAPVAEPSVPEETPPPPAADTALPEVVSAEPAPAPSQETAESPTPEQS